MSRKERFVTALVAGVAVGVIAWIGQTVIGAMPYHPVGVGVFFASGYLVGASE